MRRPNVLIVACGFALARGGCSDAQDVAPRSGSFRFREGVSSDVVRFRITNPTGLAQAESLLESGEARWAAGMLRRGDGGFNAPWPWHLDPATVSFADVTIEACQTRASTVQQDLDYWIGFGQVCLWGVVEAREH